jgi:hypothetical protein
MQVEAPRQPATDEERLELVRLMRIDPVATTAYMLGETYCKFQREALETAHKSPCRYTALLAANGMGKTFIAARFLFGRMVQDPEHGAAGVAPKEDQVKDPLFKEFRRVIEKDKQNFNFFRTDEPGGARLTTMHFRVSTVWYIKGVTANKPESMSGFHPEGGMTVIVEEASGIEDWAYREMKRWMTGSAPPGEPWKDRRMLAVSNAQRASGWLYNAFRVNRDRWNTIKATAFDSPNWTKEEGCEEIWHHFPDQEWIDEQMADSIAAGDMSFYNTAVLAEFPENDDAMVINRVKIEEAQERVLPDDDEDVLYGFIRFAADIAGPGSDRTVIGLAEGPRYRELKDYGIADLYEVRNRIVETVIDEFDGRVKPEKARYGVEVRDEDVDVIIDMNGMGNGPYDEVKAQFRRLGRRFNVIGYNGSARVTRKNRKKFPRLRSEAWYTFAQRIMSDRMDIPKSHGLAQELMSVKGDRDIEGRRYVEEKKQTRKTLGRSPDHADAMIMAYHPSDAKRGAVYRNG